MNKKNYAKPGIRIRQVQPTTILAGSSDAKVSAGGSGSNYEGGDWAVEQN